MRENMYFCISKKYVSVSDGNFNRALLPHGGYASGVRAGEAAERIRAAKTLERLLAEVMPDMADAERNAMVRRFKELLTEK